MNIYIVYIYIKKGKYQEEERDCERHLSREMETLRKEVKVLLMGRQKEKEIYKWCDMVITHIRWGLPELCVHGSGTAVSRV